MFVRDAPDDPAIVSGAQDGSSEHMALTYSRCGGIRQSHVARKGDDGCNAIQVSAPRADNVTAKSTSSVCPTVHQEAPWSTLTSCGVRNSNSDPAGRTIPLPSLLVTRKSLMDTPVISSKSSLLGWWALSHSPNSGKCARKGSAPALRRRDGLLERGSKSTRYACKRTRRPGYLPPSSSSAATSSGSTFPVPITVTSASAPSSPWQKSVVSDDEAGTRHRNSVEMLGAIAVG